MGSAFQGLGVSWIRPAWDQLAVPPTSKHLNNQQNTNFIQLVYQLHQMTYKLLSINWFATPKHLTATNLASYFPGHKTQLARLIRSFRKSAMRRRGIAAELEGQYSSSDGRATQRGPFFLVANAVACFGVCGFSDCILVGYLLGFVKGHTFCKFCMLICGVRDESTAMSELIFEARDMQPQGPSWRSRRRIWLEGTQSESRVFPMATEGLESSTAVGVLGRCNINEPQPATSEYTPQHAATHNTKADKNNAENGQTPKHPVPAAGSCRTL